MADPISVSSGIAALVTFALQSSAVLYTTVRGFQSQDKDARALKNELADLTNVLESLLDTVNNHPSIDFEALRLPLQRCGKACEEYGDLIARCTKHSTGSRPSFRDWVTQKYLQGDITDFKAMLGAYKSTINIALANANLRVTAVTPNVLEDYKEMILDTTSDLRDNLQRLDEKVQSLMIEGAKGSPEENIEWQAILEEKESTNQGLRICAQLSAQIEQLEPTSKEHPRFSQRPSAHKYIQNWIGATKGSIQTLVSRLQIHEDEIEKRIETMKSTVPLSESTATQLVQLQDTKESIHQCINVVSKAGESLEVERRNVFEDITMAEEAYDFSVSTVGDLVTVRRLNLTGRSRHVGGTLTDASYQKTVDALTKLDTTAVMSAQERKNESSASEFSDRYGRGIILSQPKDGSGVPPRNTT